MLRNIKTQHIEDIIEIQEEVIEVSIIEKLIYDKELLEMYKKKYSDTLYSLIMKSLTHEQYSSEEKAFDTFNKIIIHLKNLNKILKRDVGISVATLDYLQNISKTLNEPKIIEEDKSDVLLESSTKDELTDLYLRDIFDITIIKAIENSKRNNFSICLTMIDIDDFKKVNDTYGHQKGDLVLKNIGEVLNSSIREMDMVARYGGEELCILMPHTKIEDALKISQRIREKIEDLDFDNFKVTVSMGISQTNDEINSAQSLVQTADLSLYKAKTNGKNRIEVYKNID